MHGHKNYYDIYDYETWFHWMKFTIRSKYTFLLLIENYLTTNANYSLAKNMTDRFDV